MRATMLPYTQHYVTEADIAAVVEVLRGKWLTTGPNVEAFEKALAERVGACVAAAVSSGTAALHLAYLAAGIGPGDDIITTPLTFAATANAALYVGARPVFADIDPKTLNLDPDAVRAAITPRTKAIVAVHYGGRPCEMEALREIADKYRLLLIEDACHALGAFYQGDRVGSCYADLSIWSFHPAKHVATGEGGAVTSPRRNILVEKVRKLRNHGINIDAQARAATGSWVYEIKELGYNYRLSDINAALGTSQLKRLEANIVRRREIAAYYAKALPFNPAVILPGQEDDLEHQSAWHLYPVRVEAKRRAEIFSAMRKSNIGVNVLYIPVYYHPLYQSLGYRRGCCRCPRAEAAYEQLISLPMFASMTDQDAVDVVEAMGRVLG